MNKIGNRSFEDEALASNLNAILDSIAKRKPESIKGKYFAKAQVKTSMGPPLKLNIAPYQPSMQQWLTVIDWYSIRFDLLNSLLNQLKALYLNTHIHIVKYFDNNTQVFKSWQFSLNIQDLLKREQ